MDRAKRAPSTLKSSRAAARLALHARRTGSTAAGDSEDSMDDDVYDYIDEDQYETLVDTRRQREDFVVDDDGLGYHDDGEEYMNADDSDVARTKEKTKPKRGMNASLNEETLKKARRNNALSKETESKDKGSSGILGFVKKGSAPGKSSSSIISSGSSGGGGGGKQGQMSLDSVLDELEGPASSLGTAAGGYGSVPPSRAPSASFSSSAAVAGTAGNNAKRRVVGGKSNAAGGAKVKRAVVKRAPQRARDYGDDSNTYNDNNNDNYSGNDDGGSMGGGDDYMNNDDDGGGGGGGDMETESSPQQTAVDKRLSFGGSTPKPKAKPTQTQDHASEDDAVPQAGSDASASTIAPKKSRFTKIDVNKVSKQVQVALQAGASKPNPIFSSSSSTPSSSSSSSSSSASSSSQQALQTAPNLNLVSSTSNESTSILSEAETIKTSAALAAASANLDTVTLTNADSGDKYIDMFWLDAYEKAGVIYLFGKVSTGDRSNANANANGNANGNGKGDNNNNNSFVSCCCVVHNNDRAMFVLPRLIPTVDVDSTDTEREEGGGNNNNNNMERAGMNHVHAEMKGILTPKCIPNASGASWAGKVVSRKYAFACESVPREETKYMKIKYSSKFPPPDHIVCENGGKYFERIFNAHTSNLENFIIKRKLMGPCWIKIKSPKPNVIGISHCKIELVCNNPKDIVRIVDGDLTTPPVTTMALKMKTVVNPKSHISEIVSVSVILTREVQLDGASDETTKNMTQLSLLRPLGVTAGVGAMPQFPHDLDGELSKSNVQISKMPNERALISRLFTQIGNWDPDVIVGHNAWGFDMEVLLCRALTLKVGSWDLVGRLKRKVPPGGQGKSFAGKEWAIAEVLSGRVLCDTYLSSKELLRETTYSLTNLAATQLKAERVEIDPVDVPLYFNSSKSLIQLAQHTLMDASLVQKLCFKLQILPLTKQLTNIAGNTWARTMKGNRAERTDYLLLHEFHKLKFITPDKAPYVKQSFNNNNDDDEDGSGGGNTGGNGKSRREKSKYAGGLVLEPKKGLYQSFILLLDFNSLYPSIIQEYNLCHTTMEWSAFHAKMLKSNPGSEKAGKIEILEGEGFDDVGGVGDAGADANASAASVKEKDENIDESLPPLPDDSLKVGVLPKVIKAIIERRGIVKKMIKAPNISAEKRNELDIRQKALKLTANSMYGCLGFQHSRFYAQPIAALITAMGRETLQRTVDIAQDTCGLEVIYGDTDSIMINTGVTDMASLSEVVAKGNQVKLEVNKLYKTLELEMDGIFKSMLLLKKKKYAAVTVVQNADGTVTLDKEMKGLDLVRRDWCIQSKDTGRYVLDQILSGEDNEIVVMNIHVHLEALALKMRGNELSLDKYVITKGLSKHPNDYPDSKSLPHVEVAKGMLKNNKAVNVGDHIPYVICMSTPEEDAAIGVNGAKKKTPIEGARHPEEVVRSGGRLQIDVEWYLMHQILPPIARLCEPIEGTSSAIMAEKMGLDTRKFAQFKNSGGDDNDDDLVGYTPASRLPDAERFKDCERLKVYCKSCKVESDFPGVFTMPSSTNTNTNINTNTVGGGVKSGLFCPNPTCAYPKLWGEDESYGCMARIENALSLSIRKNVTSYYQGNLTCDDMSCNLVTKQVSVLGGACLARGCNGRMRAVYGEGELHRQVCYYGSLFDVEHAAGDKSGENDSSNKKKKRHEDDEENSPPVMTKVELIMKLSNNDIEVYKVLKKRTDFTLNNNAYNWIRPSLFEVLFSGGK